jgi:hypothetical protein
MALQVDPAHFPLDRRKASDRSYSMGTPFLCMQLSGVRLMGSKVLKKTQRILLISAGKFHSTSGKLSALEK